MLAPSSARRSPSRSPTTNVLPSSTLRVRSDMRYASSAALAPPTGRSARRRRRRRRRRNARRPRPGTRAPRSVAAARPRPPSRARRRPGSRSSRRPRARTPRPRETRSPASRRRAPRPSPSRTAPSSGSASAARGHVRTASASRPRRPRRRSGPIAVDVRRDLSVEERLLPGLDRPRQHERHAGRTRGGDRAMRPLLRRHPPDPQQVVVLALLQRPAPQVDRVRDRADRAQPRRRRASWARLMPDELRLVAVVGVEGRGARR